MLEDIIKKALIRKIGNDNGYQDIEQRIIDVYLIDEQAADDIGQKTDDDARQITADSGSYDRAYAVKIQIREESLSDLETGNIKSDPTRN